MPSECVLWDTICFFVWGWDASGLLQLLFWIIHFNVANVKYSQCGMRVGFGWHEHLGLGTWWVHWAAS